MLDGVIGAGLIIHGHPFLEEQLSIPLYLLDELLHGLALLFAFAVNELDVHETDPIVLHEGVDE